ncbi:hypothetical protein PCE1_000586 [Barthelona sp. PCE]
MTLYFERQSMRRCGLHALNNLFQESVFEYNDLRDISYEITPFKFFHFNPHHSFLGNFDVNVLTIAIERYLKEFEVKWFLPEWNLEEILNFNENLYGFLINIGLSSSKRHWITAKLFKSDVIQNENDEPYTIVQFDSLSNEPYIFPSLERFLFHLESLLKSRHHTQLLYITKKQLSDSGPDQDDPVVDFEQRME